MLFLGVAEAHNKLCYFITVAGTLHVEAEIRIKNFFRQPMEIIMKSFLCRQISVRKFRHKNLFNGLLLSGSVCLFLVFSGTFFLGIYNQKAYIKHHNARNKTN